MANFLHEKYVDMRFDAVVMIGIAGVPFLLKYRDIIAPGVPVVLSDITRATFDENAAAARHYRGNYRLRPCQDAGTR